MKRQSIRISGLHIRFLDEGGETIVPGSCGTRQGLHAGVNAPQPDKAPGAALTTAADELGRIAARRTAAFSDLLELPAQPRERAFLAAASQPN